MLTISEFFRGQNIFITGSTGFVGKALLEKLLRSCPDLCKIYVLIRQKKEKSPSERLLDITNNPLFDVLKREHPENLEKIIPITGDCMELGLGLSDHDRQMLEENVSVVFHSAASVRFDDTLKNATLLNTRGARELMLLVRNMKNLKVLVHISTSYANCDKSVIEEIIYPPHADWEEMINIVENTDEHILDILTPKILGKLPNTYVFTKSMSEHVVKDLGKDMPIVIFRPSIVISSLNDPFPGWLDNMNGPAGLLLGGGKGILRVVWGEPKIILDYIPVDVTIKVMCAAVWEKVTSSDPVGLSVYNASTCEMKSVTIEELPNIGLALVAKDPLENIMWKPYTSVTKYKFIYFCRMILVHLIPAMIIDFLLKIRGQKPMLVKIHRRIHAAGMALHYFTSNQFVIKNGKTLLLRASMLPSDKKDFGLDNIENTDTTEFYANAIKGGRVYLMKEPEEPTPHARSHAWRMWWLDAILRGVRLTFAAWFLYYSGALQSLIHYIYTSIVSVADFEQ
ncbi:fatty acyl-CoA reductase 1-like [Periplaneta americana]|uniref:fatty acyl-CoA reductase 1-like n=1 Tax=Periplaneta americana TaxID=6978 RepID=UPI0037E71101